jgi:heme A synthase
MGAVTALGDTLYPLESVGLAAAGGTHFLEQLRIVHPLLATALGILVAGAVPRLLAQSPAGTRRLGRLVVALVFVELAAGLVNVLLSAPGWMQLVHLALAVALWLALVITTAEALLPLEA